MAFTVGSGTFTNGSATVTNVSLTSGTLAYFASGTRMVVGVNPVVREVEAIAAPTVTTITLRSAWQGTGGTYDFLANQTSEGLRDAVQSIRSSNATIQSFIDSIDVQNTNNSVVQRTANGRVKTSNATEANDAVALGQIPNSAPSALYGRSNILGTVSQSAGVPTGAIIQRGSNANGEFVRYADGTQICTLRLSTFRTGINATGAEIDDTWNFPISFLSEPSLSGSTFFRNFSNAMAARRYGKVEFANTENVTVSALYKATVLDYVSGDSGATDRFFILLSAIGRWF